MKKITVRFLSLLLVSVLMIGTGSSIAYAFDDSYNVALQYEQPSTYTIVIPNVIDVSYHNKLSLISADLADDKEVFVAISTGDLVNDRGIEMTHINNSEQTIFVTLYSQEYGKLGPSNDLLCTFNNESMESTEFWGEMDDDAKPGKYRATVTFNVGLCDRPTTSSGT